jgi:hypothetical protein
MAPPSVHPCGIPYEGVLPAVSQLSPVPDAVVAILEPDSEPKRVPLDGERVGQGGRHEGLLWWSMSRLIARGILDGGALLRMQMRNVEMCEPPLPESEVARLWRFANNSRIARSERKHSSERADRKRKLQTQRDELADRWWVRRQEEEEAVG